MPLYNPAASGGGGGGSSTVAMTAEEDLTAGNPVGSSGYLPSLGAARAMRTTTQATLSFTPNETASRANQFCPIGGDKFVFFVCSDDSETLNATVGTVATSTKTVTFGTSVAATVDAQAVVSAVCKLGTDRFIVFYREDASTTIIKYRVGSVSGTTITFGAAATFFTGGTAVESAECDFISTDKGIFVGKCATGTDSRLVAFTVSGDVATAGTPLALGVNNNGNVATSIKRVGTDKFVVSSLTGGSSYSQVATISGTTITLGSEVLFSTQGGNSFVELETVSPATDVFVLCFKNSSSNSLDVIAATVSGTVPTFGAVQSSVIVATIGNAGMYAESATSILVLGSTDRLMKKLTLSGATLTLVGTVLNRTSSASPAPGRMIAMDNSYWIAVNSTTTNFATTVRGMSSNFIGIAQSTVSRGASVNVLVRGVDANQSGLTPGMIYQVSTAIATVGTLVVSSDFTTVTTMLTNNIVKAISATEIVI